MIQPVTFVPPPAHVAVLQRLHPLPGTQQIKIPCANRLPAEYAPRGSVAFDTETWLIEPGRLVPKLVCLSYADSTYAGLLRGDEALDYFLAMLRDAPEIVAHNAPFDFAVMAEYSRSRGHDALPALFRACNERRVYDTQIAEKEHAIGAGHLSALPDGSPMRDSHGKVCGYTLEWLTYYHFQARAKDNDEFRLRYRELDGSPLEAWPPNAVQYPIDDACNTLDVRKSQAKNNYLNAHDVAPRTKYALALHLGAIWGMFVDDAEVHALEQRTRATRDAGFADFTKFKFFKTDSKGKISRDQAVIKRALACAYDVDQKLTPCERCGGDGHKAPRALAGGKLSKAKRANCAECEGTGLNLADVVTIPRTEGGAVSIGRDALEEADDDNLSNFAKVIATDKTFSTYLPFMRRQRKGEDLSACLGRSPVITLKPNALLETGRVSYHDVIQQFPRKGDERSCFRARPGHVMYSVDFGSLELVTHAQSLLWICGYSKLADVMNAGGKPHDMLAATLAGISDAEYAKRKKETRLVNLRQAAKPVNFGAPGGMTELTMTLTQRKQGPDTPCELGPTWIEGDDGRPVRGYKGLRFCILVGGAARCGIKKIGKYKKRETVPVCEACVLCAKDVLAAWQLQWPENAQYFEWVNQQIEDYGAVIQHGSKRRRGNLEYSQTANTMFQELGAEAALQSLWAVCEQQYTRPESPLFGSRGTLFAHDELIGEAREEVGHEVVTAVKLTMEATLKKVCPDMANAVSAEETLMYRWYKQAKLVRDRNGRVVPWVPESTVV